VIYVGQKVRVDGKTGTVRGIKWGKGSSYVYLVHFDNGEEWHTESKVTL
jgi:hypothetical protein